MPVVKAVEERSCTFGPVQIRFDSRVLTPRSWTVLQSRWAAQLAAHAADGPLVELCAGAGSIGLAAAVLSGRALVQVEQDAIAAAYARRNAAAAGIADRVEVRQLPLQVALRPGERFPLMIADPPYLRRNELRQWPDDPVRAIDGGPDGLSLLRDCVRVAADHLLTGAPLLVQVAGAAQAGAVREHVAAAGLPLQPEELREVDPRRAVLLLRRS